MSDALNPGVVDIFLAAVSQVQGSRSGPIGRILDLKNGVVTHYNPSQGLPSRIKVQQRNGFRRLTTNGHSSDSGATSNPSWSNPELLSSVGGQILSIANAIPRVYDETDWTNYSAERVVSNNLSESTFHTSQRTIQAQDHAWIGGVTCKVWSERTNPESTATVVYIGFKSDDGAWVTPPRILYDPGTVGDHVLDYARVIADTEGVYFWVVYNAFDSVPIFVAKLFDTNGQLIDTDSVTKIWDTEPGYWDIVQIPDGGCLLAQPLHTLFEDTDGVKFTAFTQVAGSISKVTTDNSSIHCRGPLAWQTNNIGDDLCYLATIGEDEDPAGKLWGYQIDPADPDPATHEYDFNTSLPSNTLVDSLIGFVTVNSDPDNVQDIPDLTVSFTVLQTQAQTSGPLFDPQLRYSKVYTCDFEDVVTFIRQNDYTCQVSRAFLHDDEYYSINYYQSGSGNALQSTSLEVDFTPGDYMIGQKNQPLPIIPSVDKTFGSPKVFSNLNPGRITATYSPVNIDDTGSPDKVELVANGSIDTQFPPGMTFAKWTLKNLNVVAPIPLQGLLKITGSSIPSANSEFVFITGSGSVIYTYPISQSGSAIAPGTFVGNSGAGGTAEIESVTFYNIGPDLLNSYDLYTGQFLIGGEITIAGDTTPANNGDFTINQLYLEPFPNAGSPWKFGVVVKTTTQTLPLSSTVTATLTTTNNNQWVFSTAKVDDSLLIGPHTLVVENDTFSVNGNSVTNDSTGDGYSITDVPSITSIETDGSAITAQYFNPTATGMKASIRVPDDVTEFTFFLQDVVPDYTFYNATLIVRGDTVHPENNGAYTITDFDVTNNLIYCVPADGHTEQRSQMFIPDDQAITILFQTNVNPEFQPCWLMVPLTGTKPVVGRFEYGLAYADWRYEGSDPEQLFPLSVFTPVMGADGWKFVLPYRAISFTVGQSIATANGQVVNAAIASSQSTVGLKEFQLSNKTGNATLSSSQLMLPGPMCGQFTSSGFTENGVNFGFEAPFLISQDVSDNAAALTPGGSYQVIAVGEFTEEDGDRVFSIVSPPLNFRLTGDNNSATYGIRMIQPFDTDGNPIAKHFGVTNRRLVGISLYRTAYQNGAPTTDHHKITLDLNVNGLAPVTATNASGFSFPDEFTASYVDENIDAAIISNEILYTDKGFLPRFPAPAQRNGAFWKQRSWAVGYDGAIWMSNEKREGDAISFFPLFRIFLPTTDKPVACAELDNYLIVGCEKSIWYIPVANFKDATGREGTLPQPVQLPFSNGCTGHMITLREGVAYSSTDGGIWMITRALTNVWLSQSKQDSFGLLPITGMALDKRQRLIVACQIGGVFAYDQTAKTWYTWQLPLASAQFVTSVGGEIAFQEDEAVWIYDPFIYYDDLAGTKVGIPIDVTFSSFNFGSVRGVKSLWALQIVGDYKGPHHLNATLTYPDDYPDVTDVFPDPDDYPYTPDPTQPYLMEINPQTDEQASSYGLRIFTDFTDLTRSFNAVFADNVTGQTWTFGDGAFTQFDVGSTFVLSGSEEGNDGTYTIDSVINGTTITTIEVPAGDETFTLQASVVLTNPPGNSCEIELVSCEVGGDPSVGLNKFVDSRRIPGR